jgi:capsular exopolysaccharide synthesis family protein
MFVMVLFDVAFVEFQSRKISVTEEVSHGLGLKVVGTVPAIPSRARKPSAANAAKDQLWEQQLHEAVDAIRTVLLHHARTEPLRVIMVTSAGSGEGKTTLATQLAASLARAWKRTLVIDGDLRHPRTHQIFDVAQEPGLAEVLRGEVDVADAIRATSFSRLWLLPAGRGDNHAIQALAQDSVETILEGLQQQYDFIIVDSPPLLPVADSLMLAQHMDGVLLAVLRDVSRAPAIHAAQQKLAPLEVHTLGAVVIGAQPDSAEKNYRDGLMPTAK